METDVELLNPAVNELLGDPESWESPVDFPHSLALSTLNSIYSLNAQSAQGINVLRRYRDHRQAQGALGDYDHVEDLLDVMKQAGGHEEFADKVLDNRRPLSGEMLRAEGVPKALQVLLKHGVNTPDDLHNIADHKLKVIEHEWQQIPGLKQASWDYFLMNSGHEGVKVDIRIRRFIARALDVSENQLRDDRIKAAFADVAKLHGVKVRQLDPAVWIYEENHN